MTGGISTATERPNNWLRGGRVFRIASFVVCVLAVGNRMCSAMFRDVTPQTVRRFQVANMIHLISVGTLVVMWLGKIAILQ